jgi:hypothetical protein
VKERIRIAPPNSQFYLEDSKGGESPQIDESPINIWSTPSCILVGCLCFSDGETDLIVSDSGEDAPSVTPAFEGILDTPSRIFQVSTSERTMLLRCKVSDHFSRVRIWTDHPFEPEHILVVLG